MTPTPKHKIIPAALANGESAKEHGSTSSGSDHGFLRTWIHHLPVVLGLSLVVAYLAHLGWFQEYQTMALDSLLLAQSSRRSDQVVIVTIGDDEFRSPELFNSTSPLQPEKLGLLLTAIAAGKPRVIAVDIDTSSDSPAKKEEYHGLADLVGAESWPPVIWSVDGEVDPEHHGGHGVPTLQVSLPLAGTRLARSGLITMPTDLDGVIRRYYRSFPTIGEGEHESKPVDSLPWAVVKEYVHQTPEANRTPQLRKIDQADGTSHATNELLMNFPGDRFTFTHITAKTVLDSHSKREFWSSEKSPIHDKIVLVGGTYRAARDVHPTPVGRVPGVELLAMAIESELQGTGIRFMHEAFSILIDILFGSLLVYLNWRFNSPRAMLLNLLAVGVLALLASYITFNTLGYWLNFALVLVGVWTHHQLDIAREIPQLHKEVHDLKSIVRNYERERVTNILDSETPKTQPQIDNMQDVVEQTHAPPLT